MSKQIDRSDSQANFLFSSKSSSSKSSSSFSHLANFDNPQFSSSELSPQSFRPSHKSFDCTQTPF